MKVRHAIGLAVAACLLGAGAARAFPPKLSASGVLDFAYGDQVTASGAQATAYKPESKLFYTDDDRWWAVLGAGSGVHLYQLVNHDWEVTRDFPGADPWAKADTLLDGDTLYVSLRDNRSVSGNPRVSTLYTLTYLGDGSWSAPSGPTTITTGNPETLTIARDSTGRLWTTYESSLRINVGSTAPGGTAFTFATLPTSDVNSDDISAITAFGTATSGYKIGVFWSDQAAQRDWFAWRRDDDPIASSSWHIETAYGGGVGGCSKLCADDHVNIKVNGDTLYVGVKTSLNDPASPNPDDPLIVLLRRSASGAWSAFPVSPVSQGATRPVVLLAPASDRIWVFAARSSTEDVWESSLSSPGFSSGAFATWTKGAVNSTSTKQLITSTSGAVVETSASGHEEYWHNEFLP